MLKEYIFDGGSQQEIALPRYTGAWEKEGNFAIIGDMHLPTTKFRWLNGVVLPICQKQNLKQLILAGDLFNFDALSHFQNITPSIELTTELEIGKQIMQHLFNYFDNIYYFMGNHDYRIHRLFDGDIKSELVRDMISSKLEVSTYAYMTVTSGNEHWRITHPKNYSRIQLRNADELAQKYQTNIISWHEHHIGVGRDKYNHYTIVNGGGMFDTELMAYVSLEDSIMPRMKNGFVMLIDGTAEVITPYASMTKIEKWL